MPEIHWNRTFGTIGDNDLIRIRPAADGGYWLGGFTDEFGGGDRTEPTRGGDDYWIMKLDAAGNKQWDRTLGGPGWDYLQDICPTADGGAILGGRSWSGQGGDKTQPSQGQVDWWIVKVDAQGRKQWDRTLGGSRNDHLWSLKQTPDGGYVLAGNSDSPTSGDVTTHPDGIGGYWVVKLDASGNKQWDRVFRGNGFELPTVVLLTPDGGYLVGGTSQSGISADKSEPAFGRNDQWIIKLDANGRKQWDRTFGGYQDEDLLAMLATPDGGYLLGGSSSSGISSTKTQPNYANSGDYWLVKIDAQGRQQWDRTYGGTGFDQLTDLQLTADKGYLVGGWTFSGISGDKTSLSRGEEDGWVLKLNANGALQWDQSFGAAGHDAINSLLLTADQKFIGAGVTNSAAFVPPKPAGYEKRIDWWVFMADPTPPSLRITGDTLLCAGGQVTLTAIAGPGAASYRWSTGATTAAIEVRQAGSYQVTATFADGQVRTARRVVFPFTPTLVLQGDTLLCPGQSIRLAAGGTPADSYRWSTGASTPAIQVTQPGLYTLTARYPSGCEVTQQLVVRAPVLRLLGAPLLCSGSGSQTTLEAQAPGAVAYRWNTGATTPTLRITSPGTYSVAATFSNGCTLTATEQVTVPQLSILGDSLLCPGQTVQLAAGGLPAVSYRWNNGATSASIRVQQPGSYSLTATYANGCSRTATIRVLAGASLPSLPWVNDTTLCAGSSLLLRAPLSSQPLMYRWSDGSTTPTLLVNTAGTYTLTVTSPCEQRTYSRRINLKSCVFLPNIVTANGDGLNDYFVPTGLAGGNWQLTIFNRWGRQVYEAASYANNWGPEAAPGTYFYLLQQATTGIRYKGTIEVVR
ncbi:gliding motility-associated C-terminal domain-containing protein [Hymenobacter pini]|uniref:gliding motility-associated C-terminal domain-containing protein n=1 Tax=Hymenobacter pini TaxID=2880879 RepID=UPI001CF46629|nr:gliding motility-associated C-terminal domain-containing protein [Hymenobacter pini]MCA8830823.1 gliding motility-associated C-terminal domain-containing protein [Hymenobacter pini]